MPKCRGGTPDASHIHRPRKEVRAVVDPCLRVRAARVVEREGSRHVEGALGAIPRLRPRKLRLPTDRPVGRASDCKSEGRWFKSSLRHGKTLSVSYERCPRLATSVKRAHRSPPRATVFDGKPKTLGGPIQDGRGTSSARRRGTSHPLRQGGTEGIPARAGGNVISAVYSQPSIPSLVSRLTPRLRAPWLRREPRCRRQSSDPD